MLKGYRAHLVKIVIYMLWAGKVRVCLSKSKSRIRNSVSKVCMATLTQILQLHPVRYLALGIEWALPTFPHQPGLVFSSNYPVMAIRQVLRVAFVKLCKR